MKRIYKVLFCVMLLVFLIFINYILKDNDLYYFLFSFSMFIIFINSFSHINIEEKIIELKDKKYDNSQVKLFYAIIGSVLFINFLYFLVVYILNIFLNESIYFEKYIYISYAMVCSIWVIPTVNVITQYLSGKGNKNLSCLIKRLFYCFWFISIIILLIVYYCTSFNKNLFIILIYLLQYISFILVVLILSTLIKGKGIFKLGNLKKRKENNENILSDVKFILKNNIYYSIKNIINISYYYFSIVITYVVIIYKYNYPYNETVIIITDTYFYFFLLILILCTIFIEKYKSTVLDIMIDIKEKSQKGLEIVNLFVNIIKNILPLTLLLCILSGPILKIIFNNSNSVIFMLLIWIFPFIVLYSISLKIIEVSSLRKNIIYTILFSGLLVKVIFTLPMINSFYRMGYNVIYGDIIASIMGLFTSFIVMIIYINKKYKINFTKVFEKILNVIYESILLCLILVICSMIIPLNVNSNLEALVVILVYVIIYELFLILKRVIKKVLGGN